MTIENTTMFEWLEGRHPKRLTRVDLQQRVEMFSMDSCPVVNIPVTLLPTRGTQSQSDQILTRDEIFWKWFTIILLENKQTAFCSRLWISELIFPMVAGVSCVH